MKPEDKGSLRCHKSLATVLSLLYILPDWSAQCRRSLQKYMLALVTEINIAMYIDVVFLSEKWLALCDPIHAVCMDRLFSCACALHNLPRPAVPPISTTANFSTAPPPASKLSKRFKFAKEEKLLHVQSLLKACSWFLKE